MLDYCETETHLPLVDGRGSGRYKKGPLKENIQAISRHTHK